MAAVDTFSGLDLTGDPAGVATSQLDNWRSVGKEGAMVPRPPLVAKGMGGLDRPIYGLYRWQTQMIAADDQRKLFRISESVSTSAFPISDASSATLLDGTARPVFTGTYEYVLACGGGEIQKWKIGDPLSSRLGAGPTAVTHVCTLGQRVIANDRSNPDTRQRFYWSDLSDPLTWNPLSTQQAESRNDEIVAISENTAYLWIFGESTIEIYTVGTDPDVPWDKLNAINIGLAAPYAFALVNDSFALIDDRRRIVMCGANGVEDPDVGKPLEGFLRTADLTDAWMWRETHGRWDMLCLHLPNESRTFEYDLSTKAWAERKHWNGATNGSMPIACYAYWPAVEQHLFGSSAEAEIYYISDTPALELGKVIVCDRITGHSDYAEANSKGSRRVRVRMRRGTGGPGTVTDRLELRVDDDANGFNDWESIDVGGDGDGLQLVDFFPGGVFNTRRIWIRYAGTSATSVIAVVDDTEVLDS